MSKKQTKYVDGFVLIVPKDKVSAYKKIAKRAGDMWMKYGALRYRECMIEDATPEFALLTFGKMIKAKPDETVWFSYIEYESKAHRNKVNKTVMSSPEMQKEDSEMPFDMKKMAYGGFKVVVAGD